MYTTIDKFLIAFICLLGCSDEAITELIEMPIVSPGQLIPINTHVKVFDTGTYLLPSSAHWITTQCYGKITVAFTPREGLRQSNTCHSEWGGSKQTNHLGGAREVLLTLEPGSWSKIMLH